MPQTSFVCCEAKAPPPCPLALSGYQPYEKGCLRRDLIQAVPFCPTHAFQLFQHGSESECIKLTETEPLLTCKEGVFDATLALCVSHGAEDPAVSCPPGFELNAEQVRTVSHCLSVHPAHVQFTVRSADRTSAVSDRT